MELMPDDLHAAQTMPSNAPAYNDYLKGRYYWNMLADTGVEPALEHFEFATRLDPSFALAHVGKARLQILKAEYYRTRPRQMLEAARQSVKRAMDLDPDLFEAHLALGEVRRMLEWDWRGAEAAYAQAIVLNPSHETAHRSYALLLAALARPDHAVERSAGEVMENKIFRRLPKHEVYRQACLLVRRVFANWSSVINTATRRGQEAASFDRRSAASR